MGSASRKALKSVQTLLQAPLAASVATELLCVAGQLRQSSQLVSALTEPSPAAPKTILIDSVYKQLSAATRNIIAAAANEKFSNTQEFIDGLQILGIRAAAITHPGIDEELVQVANAIDASADLELHLGSKLAESAKKIAAVQQLFGTKVSPVVLEIVKHLVANPGQRRLSPALREAANIAADQSGYILAQVTAVSPLDAQRSQRLRDALSRVAGRPVKLNTVIDPTLVGGLRVQIADEIIDGSVSARLHDLRLQLAG